MGLASVRLVNPLQVKLKTRLTNPSEPTIVGKVSDLHKIELVKCRDSKQIPDFREVETTIAERHDTGNIVFIPSAIVANPVKDSITAKGSISQ